MVETVNMLADRQTGHSFTLCNRWTVSRETAKLGFNARLGSSYGVTPGVWLVGSVSVTRGGSHLLNRRLECWMGAPLALRRR